MRRLLSLLIPSVVGAVAGVGAALVVSQRSPELTPTLPLRSDQVKPRHERKHSSTVANVRALQRGHFVESPVAEAPKQEDRDPPLPADNETEVGESESSERPVKASRQGQALAEFANQPVDPTWSRASEASLREDLQQLSEVAELRELECRTFSCVGTLRFANRDAVVDRQGAILHHLFALNCARMLYFADPDATPYDAKFIVRCRHRAGED